MGLPKSLHALRVAEPGEVLEESEIVWIDGQAWKIVESAEVGEYIGHADLRISDALEDFEGAVPPGLRISDALEEIRRYERERRERIPDDPAAAAFDSSSRSRRTDAPFAVSCAKSF